MLPRRLLMAMAATSSALTARSAHTFLDGTEIVLPGVGLFVCDTGGIGPLVILLHANTGTS